MEQLIWIIMKFMSFHKIVSLEEVFMFFMKNVFLTLLMMSFNRLPDPVGGRAHNHN